MRLHAENYFQGHQEQPEAQKTAENTFKPLLSFPPHPLTKAKAVPVRLQVFICRQPDPTPKAPQIKK